MHFNNGGDIMDNRSKKEIRNKFLNIYSISLLIALVLMPNVTNTGANPLEGVSMPQILIALILVSPCIAAFSINLGKIQEELPFIVFFLAGISGFASGAYIGSLI